MDTVIRVKREELARLRELRGMHYWSELADAMGMDRRALGRILNLRDAGCVRTKTFGRLCDALSTEDHQVQLWEVIEHIPDRNDGEAR